MRAAPSSSPTPSVPGNRKAHREQRRPYLIISADTHAELPTERYREYVDPPEYREDFEAYLAEKQAAAQAGGFIDEEFAQTWFDEHGEGIAGGWDVAQRDKELDGDGVAGEVIFPDATR